MARTIGRRCLQVGFVLTLVLVTALVTRSLIPVRASVKQQVDRPGGSTIVIDRGEVHPAQMPQAAAQMPKKAAQIPPNLVRQARMAAMDVEIQGQQVIVSGQAEIYDSAPGVNYIWLLRVYTANPRKLLNEHHYVERASRLAIGSVFMTPTFRDAIDLPPGTYSVELSNYAVPPDFPLDSVKVGENMKTRALSNVARIRKVSIPD